MAIVASDQVAVIDRTGRRRRSLTDLVCRSLTEVAPIRKAPLDPYLQKRFFMTIQDYPNSQRFSFKINPSRYLNPLN